MFKDDHIKNKKAILIGITAAALYSLILCGIIQWAAASALGSDAVMLKFHGIKLKAFFMFTGGTAGYLLLTLIPVILFAAAVEISLHLLKKYEIGFKRHSIIVFALMLSGIFLFDLFHGSFMIILNSYSENDFARLAAVFKFSESGRILFPFFMIIITAGYLNLSTKRILKYINL